MDTTDPVTTTLHYCYKSQISNSSILNIALLINHIEASSHTKYHRRQLEVYVTRIVVSSWVYKESMIVINRAHTEVNMGCGIDHVINAIVFTLILGIHNPAIGV